MGIIFLHMLALTKICSPRLTGYVAQKYSIFFLSLILICSIAPPTYATVYRWISPDNTIHFSDQPHKGATPKTVGKIQTFTPKSLPQQTLQTTSRLTKTTLAYTEFNFLAPKNEETIRNNEGKVVAIFQISPALRTQDRIEFYLDGKLGVTKQPSPNSNSTEQDSDEFEIVLNNIERGTHTLTAKLIHGKSQAVRTNTVIFYMHHTSSIK
jgi:hypothetical protein